MLEKEIEALAKAWDYPGPVPEFHQQWRQRLWREWPMLAKAVQNLVWAAEDLEEER